MRVCACVCVCCVGEGREKLELSKRAFSFLSDATVGCAGAILAVEVIVAAASLAVIVCVGCLCYRSRRGLEAKPNSSGKLREHIVSVNLSAQTQEMDDHVRYKHHVYYMHASGMPV